MQINPGIFKAYDIRGIYPTERMQLVERLQPMSRRPTLLWDMTCACQARLSSLRLPAV